MFQPYFRSTSDENQARNLNSNGIGLSICKRLAQQLDCDLYLSKSYRNGCKFVLKLSLLKVKGEQKSLQKRKKKQKAPRQVIEPIPEVNEEFDLLHSVEPSSSDQANGLL